MRGLLLGLVLLACACATTRAPEIASADGPGQEPLSIDRILAQPSLTGTSPSAPAWSPDSRRLAFLWNDGAMPQREVWIVEADATGLRQLTGGEESGSGVREFVWTPDGRAVVQLRGSRLWRTELGGTTRELLRPEGRPSDISIAPDGSRISFLMDGDLWLFEVATGELERATSVAVPSISSLTIGRYSRPDVEIGPYVWGGPTYAWSPDSRWIAVHYVDRRGVRTVPFPDYLGTETDPNPVRRAYPGDPNEARDVGLYSLESDELTLLGLPDPTATRVVDFSWSIGGRLLIDRESDTAEDRWLHVVDPGDMELRQLWHDRRDSRVYTLAGSTWHPDGEHALFLGDLGDRYGLYLVGPGFPAPRLLSDPDFDVTAAPQATQGGAIVYQANDPSPRETHLFQVTADGRRRVRLTDLPGQNRGVPSPDGARLAVLHSDDGMPRELFLGSMNDGPSMVRITRSTPPDFDERPWARVRYATFPSQVDGVTLHARILEPRGLDRSRRHPVLFGPMYSNTVRNRWGGRYALIQQLLVERGYIVVQVDVRGSTGYGRAFREEFLGDFAGKDLDDLESAVSYMESLSHVDPDRIGVWGSSYGGTLTVYALLTKPGLFQAGVAGAAAVDPRFFGGDDVAIVRRPETHPDTFLRGAAQYAGNLEDHLLLIHGMQDQVVPFKTTVALAEELMVKGKDFDFAFAPAGTHGWTGPSRYARFLIGKLVGHFDRYLGAAER